MSRKSNDWEEVPATQYSRDPVTGRDVYDPLRARIIERAAGIGWTNSGPKKPALKPKVGDIISIADWVGNSRYQYWIDEASGGKWSGYAVWKTGNDPNWHFMSQPNPNRKTRGSDGEDVKRIHTHIAYKPKPVKDFTPAKIAKAIVSKAAMPRNVQIWAIVEECKRIVSDVSPIMNVVGFHRKWNAFIKQQMSKARKVDGAKAEEIVGLLDTIASSNNRNVISSASNHLNLKNVLLDVNLADSVTTA